VQLGAVAGEHVDEGADLRRQMMAVRIDRVHGKFHWSVFGQETNQPAGFEIVPDQKSRRKADADAVARSLCRSLVLALYFMVPPTPMTTLVFGAFMGFLWLGVGPLVAGAVVEMFGLQWQAMIQGLAFMSHQLGSFVGAYGGGLIYDAAGSYTLAWRIGVAVGFAAGIIQVAFALIRPTAAPPVLRTA